MAIYKRDIVNIDLETGNIHRSFLKHTIGMIDNKADHFGVKVYRNGEPVSLSGVTVQGIFMPPQGDPIAITTGGIINNNEAEIVLPQACYNYEGQFTLAIKLVSSTQGITGTVRIVDGVVENTHATGTVAPTGTVPTYQEVLAAFDDAIAVIDDVDDLKDAVNARNGDAYGLADVLEKYGYILPMFSREAWDFENDTKVSANNVVMASVDQYEDGKYIIVTIPSGYSYRVTFLDGTTVKSATEWLTTSRGIRNSLGADNFTVEFKYTNGNEIEDAWSFVSKAAIQLEYKIINYAEQKAIYPYEGPVRSIMDDYAFYTPNFQYGAWDFVNERLVDVKTVIHVEFDYTIGKRIYITGADTENYKYRVSFWNGTTHIGNTGWRNDEAFSLLNTVTGVDTVAFEIRKDDSSEIKDIVPAIGSYAFKKDETTIQKLKDSIDSFAADDISTIGIFDKWATIGDSFSVGRWYINQGGTLVPVRTSRLAWGSIIAREVGNTFLSLGIGGINTRTWLTADPSTGGGLALALSSPAQDLYFLCLGINDTSLGASYIGSESDIHDNNYSLNADTFYGNYGRIIQQMKEHAPDCLFVISKLVAWNDASVKDAYNEAIEGIAEHFGIPCIDPNDDYFFTSDFYMNYRGHNNGHPTGMTYGGMAMAYRRLMAKCMNNNPNYFKYYNGVADGGA